MKMLTETELSTVVGGDAAATREAGQNSWGENVSGGAAHYYSVMADADLRVSLAESLAACYAGLTQGGPNMDCVSAASKAWEIMKSPNSLQ